MKLTKALVARIALIIGCAAISATCLFTIADSADPLARYSKELTESQKEIILKYLSDEDIDYMVEYQLNPEDLMNFIEVDGFLIKNAKLYSAALATQEADKKDIVNFVNKYRSHFSRSALKNLLTHYTYLDLVNFYETEQVLNPKLKLVDMPENPYLILSKNTSVYKYVPQNLVDINTISVRQEMVEDLTSLINAYESTLNHKIEFLNGYTSYEKLVDDSRIRIESSPYIDHILNPAGSNEEQLGYTIILKGQDDWLASCIEHVDENDQVDYDASYDALSAKLRDEISWIEDNAYHYGFVIRYTEDGEASTGLWYQPFVLRYVGKKTAKSMHKSNSVMENTTFSKTLK
ncbi:MAG: D-alanyl-D-alanine carboxypeptidase family protein [Bacillota bacterium]|nr:D-alanyl-D-alanine carboxypeptidase family protein [Bacillota bacterium]